MRKQIEPDKICSKCGAVLKRGKEEWFCDICKEKIGESWLSQRITVFFKDDSPLNHTTGYDVCSWKCVAEWLKNPPINKDMVEFITIPYIASHSENFTTQLNDFLEALRE